MAAIRRAPRAPSKPRSKIKAPLHQRILGRGAVELDAVQDQRIELEQAYSLDLIEYDDYLLCHDALNLREEKAKETLLKATGKFVKPEKRVDIKARKVRRSQTKDWKVKLILVLCFLIYIKFFHLNA